MLHLHVERRSEVSRSCSSGGALRLARLFVLGETGDNPVESYQDNRRPGGCILYVDAGLA